MNAQNVTAAQVEAQETCAKDQPIPFIGMGTIAHQPYFKPIARRDLMAAVNTVARDLGLRAASVVVIDALLSCLPCKDPKTGQDRPITSCTLLTVFAANTTLCFRAKGITDRQLRRHLERLEEIGLIQRKDSANGKRFPVQRDGRVIGAFGIDLSPLLARSEELCTLAAKRRAEVTELRGLRACIQKLRQDCAQLELGDDMRQFVDATANMMRRATTTVLQARALITRLSEILSRHSQDTTKDKCTQELTADSSPREPDQPNDAETKLGKMPASDGQNVRHKETPKPYTKKIPTENEEEFWAKLETLNSFYPDPPRTKHRMLQIIFEFGRMLRMQQETLSEAIAKMGTKATLLMQDQIAGSCDAIANTDAYAKRIIKATCQVGHGQLPTTVC
ncbi:MAG: replication protein C [Natronohydrobacter sp.]|nr:replication protein C [Natronohydrobacter sp.]